MSGTASSAAETAPRKVWTEAELQALPEEGFQHEVVNGELVMGPKNEFYHGEICARLLVALMTFARARQLGGVLDSSTGFWMKNRNCRAPDVSFVSRERLQGLGFRRSTRRFFPARPTWRSRFFRSTIRDGNWMSGYGIFLRAGRVWHGLLILKRRAPKCAVL